MKAQASGDLARCIVHDPNDDWPHSIEIRATWITEKGGRRYRSIHISGDAFFGRGGHGAPMTGERMLQMVDQIRRQGPERK